MNIKLSKIHLANLLQMTKSPQVFRKISVLLDHAGSKNHRLQLTDLEKDELLEELTDAFCEKGLDESDNPNNLGYLIEEIIDKIHNVPIYDE